MTRALARLLRLLTPSASTAARNLARHGAAQRRNAWVAKRNATAQQMRRETGLAPHEALR